MAMWPENVNNSPLLEGYSRSPINSKLVSSVDAGVQKVRQRFTAAPEIIIATFIWTKPEMIAFRDWYNNDIKGGSEEFFTKDPETDITTAFEFVPNFTPIYNVIGFAKGGPLYSVQLEIQTVVV